MLYKDLTNKEDRLKQICRSLTVNEELIIYKYPYNREEPSNDLWLFQDHTDFHNESIHASFKHSMSLGIQQPGLEEIGLKNTFDTRHIFLSLTSGIPRNPKYFDKYQEYLSSMNNPNFRLTVNVDVYRRMLMPEESPVFNPEQPRPPHPMVSFNYLDCFTVVLDSELIVTGIEEHFESDLGGVPCLSDTGAPRAESGFLKYLFTRDERQTRVV